MAETTNKNVSTTNSLILIPSVITLAITILRLIGELQNWSPAFFSRAAGGGGALVGISWLAPIFGAYFAVKLVSAGSGPASAMKSLLRAVIGVVIVVVLAFVATKVFGQGPGALGTITVGMIVAAVIQQGTWPALFKTLLTYGLAARIPVIIVMFIAIRGDWGTHYDVVPPGDSFPAMGWMLKWVMIGVVPQLLVWVPFTILSGSILGSIAAAIAGRKSQTHAAPA